jgi:hypothetical protein
MGTRVEPFSGKVVSDPVDPSFNSVTITGDGDGSTQKVVGALYGITDPPTPPTGIPNGTLYLKYMP